MKTNKDIEKELEGLAPNFSKLKKENPFGKPHNYFDEMQAAVFDQITEQPRPSVWTVLMEKVNQLFSPQLAMAIAGVAIVIAAFFFLSKEDNSMDQLVSADTSMIEAYIAANIEEFDSELLIDLALEEDIDFSTPENISQDELLDELMEDFDDNELMNLL